MPKQFYQRLHASFRNSAQVAYRHFETAYTYEDMYSVVRTIYSYLERGAKEKIIIFSSKSFESYGAIFGTLLSGNIWVPMSPTLAPNRNIDILKMTEPKVIFTDAEIPDAISIFANENNIKIVHLSSLCSEQNSQDVILPDFDGEDVAYIMFTSGSTGAPKGVPMTHNNYINFVNNCLDILPFKKGEVFSDAHDFAFDISVFYLFCFPLTGGAISPLLKDADRFFPLNFIEKNNVTVWSSVPSVIGRIKRLRPDMNMESSIHIMFLCGEPFPLGILEYCWKNLNIKHVYNFYGLTETGVENFYHPCVTGDLERFEPFGFVPIGKPLPGNEADIGTNGELILSGRQITPGYLSGVGEDRFFVKNAARWFFTGDIVEKFEDVWFCKGRMDTQVKLHGYRVELMDVEVNVKRCMKVQDVICFVVDENVRQRLVAVVNDTSKQKIDVQAIKQQMKEHIPEYMVPDIFLFVDSFPVNQNGKIDRKKVRLQVIDEI